KIKISKNQHDQRYLRSIKELDDLGMKNEELKMKGEELIIDNEGLIMEGWEEKELGELLNIERGGSPRPISKYLTDDENGINWIKISDATNSTRYIYETKQKIREEGLAKTKLVEEGDFILSNSMSFGRPYIMKTTGAIHD